MLGIPVIVNTNVINHMVLLSMKIVNENIDEVKIVNESKYKCNSYILYIVLLSIFFPINFGIGAYFLNFHVYLKKMFTCETTIY